MNKTKRRELSVCSETEWTLFGLKKFLSRRLREVSAFLWDAWTSESVRTFTRILNRRINFLDSFGGFMLLCDSGPCIKFVFYFLLFFFN